MWSFRREDLEAWGLARFFVELNGQPASYADVVQGWQVDEEFRSLFSQTLANSEFPAFRWETPPVSAGTLTRPFEFVLVNSPGLARHPDRDAFAEHFKEGADDGVVVFPNLGGDAIMVVPCPIVAATAYGHIAAFVRDAPEKQQHSLWQAVGKAISGRVGSRLVWLSTAGGGVSWLHVRLDDRPKYYAHRQYAEAR
jgi:hypothetical protein